MRLNRVLLLAATINILVFALVFISCSGDDGARGKDGGNCWVEDSSDGNGWDVFCGSSDKPIGGLKNNDSGDRGEPGDPGAQGKQGDYCLLGNSTANGYEILCGGESKGFLDGCTVTSYPRNQFQSALACGKGTKPINLCNGKIFDPAKSFCDENNGETLETAKSQGICGPKLTTYNKNTHYCGFATKADSEKGIESVIPLCGLDLPKTSNFTVIMPNTDIRVISEREAENSSRSYTLGGTSVAYASLSTDNCKELGGRLDDWSNGNGTGTSHCVASLDVCRSQKNSYWIASQASGYRGGSYGIFIPGAPSSGANQDRHGACATSPAKWNNEYCRHFVYFASNDYTTRLSASIASNKYCTPSGEAEIVVGASNSQLAVAANTINKDGWKSEYCGFAKSDVLTKSVVKGVCDDYGKFTKYGHYGSVSADWQQNGGGSTIVPGLGPRPYVATATLVEQDVGPNELAFGYGYCTILEKDYSRLGDAAKTTYTSKLCGTSKNNKVNENTWKHEYCGYSSDSKGNVTQTVFNDICNDGRGPKANENNFQNGYCEADRPTAAYPTGFTRAAVKRCMVGKTPKATATNEKTWQGQYCGYANATTNDLKVWDGICDDESGPHQEGYGYNYGYCQAYKNDETGKVKTALVLRADTCDDGKKYNEGAWKGEYCGIPAADQTLTTVQQGGCDLGQGPNSGSFASGYCRAKQPVASGIYAGVSLTEYTVDFCGESGKPNDGAWKSEYCGIDASGSQTVQTGVCDDGIGPNSSGFGSGYCAGIDPSKKSEADRYKKTVYTSDFCGESGKPNDGSWKGEYCFADKQVGTCTGGYKADVTKNSTDPLTVRCVFTNNFTCSTSNLVACDKDNCDALGVGYAWDSANNECVDAKAEPKAKRALKKLAKK